MEKLDKVIAGLECCGTDAIPERCKGCPYERSVDLSCVDSLMVDALALLKTLDQTRMDLEVTRMNLGAAREELNRLEGSCDGGDLISRSALLEYGVRVEHGLNEDGILYIPLRDVTRSIENAPAVEAELVVHAHWDDGRCSRCDSYFSVTVDGEEVTLYDMNVERCPKCGAHMDEEVSE